MSEALYELRQVRKVYQGPAEEVTVLSGLDFTIAPGDSLAILGPRVRENLPCCIFWAHWISRPRERSILPVAIWQN